MLSPAELETTIDLSQILVRGRRCRALYLCGIIFAVQMGKVKARDFVKTRTMLKSYFPTSGVLDTEDTVGVGRPSLPMKPISSPAESVFLLVSLGTSFPGLISECYCTA